MLPGELLQQCQQHQRWSPAPGGTAGLFGRALLAHHRSASPLISAWPHSHTHSLIPLTDE